MIRVFKMLPCVCIFRGIAAAGMAARKTQTDLNPGVASLQTILAPFCGWRYFFDLIFVGTFFLHRFSIAQSKTVL